jgi:hypothetical protein
MDEDAIRRLARDAYTGKAFLTLKPEDVEYSFGGVLTMITPQLAPEYIESIGACWEYMTEAGPLAVNGRPMFLSIRFVNKEDVKLVVEEMKRIHALIEQP